MRIEGGRESRNVEDRRGQGTRRGPMLMGGGVGALVVIVVAVLFGGNPLQLLNQLGQNAPPAAGNVRIDPAHEGLKKFVSVVLADTEDVWNAQFTAQQLGRPYQEPKLILFSNEVDSACGVAGASVGPFYCPGDNQVYIDLSFYDELKRRFQAPGDFAQAYVIAHEVGHHVQNLLGYSDKVHQGQRAARNKEEANRLSVRLELHADFLAGVWAHHAQRMRDILEEGDIEEALRAAHQIGDDTLQKGAQGYIVPENFTHGSADQRVRWFTRGFKSGQFRDGEAAFTLPYERL